MIDVKAAMEEVQKKSAKQIELESAEKWAARAIACYRKYKETQSLDWLLRAEDYTHEAVEHAALSDESADILKSIRSQIDEEIK